MSVAWSPEDLERIGATDEVEVAARRGDGTMRPWVPIWVVRAGEQVYVRTWHRRGTGWFGQVVESGRARIRAPGLEVDVLVEDVGEGSAEIRAGIDAAYLVKYRSYGDAAERMVTDNAVAATLRFVPE